MKRRQRKSRRRRWKGNRAFLCDVCLKPASWQAEDACFCVVQGVDGWAISSRSGMGRILARRTRPEPPSCARNERQAGHYACAYTQFAVAATFSR